MSVGPLRFVCLTNDATDVRDEIECMPYPTVALRQPYNNTGCVQACALEERASRMKGDWLFLDLDAIVMMSLDVFFEFKPDVY